MKKSPIVVAALAILSISAVAGPSEPAHKAVVPPCPEVESFYNGNEFSVGLSALLGVRSRSSIDRINDHRDWGNSTRPGVDLEGKYFFTRYFGVGIEQQYIDVDRPLWDSALNLYLRAPLGEGSHWAVYMLGGAGAVYRESIGRFEAHGGAGIEYRFTKKIGIFADGRYTWVDGDKVSPHFGTFRLGLDFVF